MLKNNKDDEQKNAFKKYLCELLKNDSEVQRIIVTISNTVYSNKLYQEANHIEQKDNKKIEELLHENEKLNKKIICLQNEIQDKENSAIKEKEEIESKNRKLEKTYNELKLQLQKEKEINQHLSEQIAQYKNNYSSFEKVFSTYNSLGNQIYSQLERVLKSRYIRWSVYVITTDFVAFKTRYEKDSGQIGYNMFKI